jgi:hypothetical protein
MAILNFKIMRGLPVPDNNFTWPIGDSWVKSSSCASGDFIPVGPRAGQGLTTEAGADQWGTGRALKIIPTSGYPTEPAGNYYIESSYTPYGICALGAGGNNLGVWVGVIAKTFYMTSNQNVLLDAFMQGYSTSGLTTGWAIPLTNAGRQNLKVEETDYALYSGYAAATPTTPTAFYKLRLRFAKGTVHVGDGAILIGWCGVAVPFNTATGYDQVDSWYTHEVPHSTGTERRWQSSKYRSRPRVQVLNAAEHRAVQSYNFPLLDDDDKRLIQTCWMWNAGTPTDDVIAGVRDSSYHVNRGQSLPVVVVAERDETKRAFYADFSSEPQFSPAAIGWWPEAGARWQTSCTFEERL